jgi:hypothetical protein
MRKLTFSYNRVKKKMPQCGNLRLYLLLMNSGLYNLVFFKFFIKRAAADPQL